MSRLNKTERDLWYPFIVERDGEFCRMCGKTPLSKDPSNHVSRLLIHETEYKRPLKAGNLMFLCDSCNQHVHPPKPEKFKREMPPELQINREKEPIARQYMVNRILTDGSCEYKILLAATAERAGCSTKTADTYLDKLTSDEGILENVADVIYLRGYEPKMKYDFMTNAHIISDPAKPIPPDVVKEIQTNLGLR